MVSEDTGGYSRYYLDRSLRIAEEANIIDNPVVRRLLLAVLVTDDAELAQEVELALSLVTHRRIINPAFGGKSFIHESQLAEEFLLGHCEERLVTISKDDILRNALIVGLIGSGKTNLIKSLVTQLISKGLKVWIFDIKDEYRVLQQWVDIEVFDWRDLKLNLLNFLHGGRPMENAKLFSQIFCHRSGFQKASTGFVNDLVTTLFKIYEEKGALGDGIFPSIYEAQQLAESMKIDRGTQTWISRDRVVRSLKDLRAYRCDIFNCARGFPIKALAQKNMIFNLKGLSPEQMSTLSEALMAGLYYYLNERRVRSGKTNLPLSHVIISDEAKNLFNRRLQQEMRHSLPYTDKLVSESRIAGMGYIFAEQEPKELTSSIIENSHVKVMMQLGSGGDITIMGNACGLNSRQTLKAYRLKTGEALVKVVGEDVVGVKIPLMPF